MFSLITDNSNSATEALVWVGASDFQQTGKGLLHGGKVSQHHVDCMNRVGADGLVQLQGFRHAAARQHLVQHVPADQRHEAYGHLERAIFASLARQGDVQVHLEEGRGEDGK